MSWLKLKNLIQSMDKHHKGRKKGEPFEELVAKLLELLLEIPFVAAESGTQPSGDVRSLTGEVSIQTKNYSDKTPPRAVEIVGDIDIVRRNLQDLQVYVLVISRDISAQLLGKLEAISEETGLDIVTLKLTDKLSDLGALCVTFWEDICHFFDLSNTNQEFLDWVQIAKDDSKTKDKMKDVQSKLEDGIQTQRHVQKDTEKYLRERFSRAKGFNPINLSQAIVRDSLESQITVWWESEESPICCLEGKEGHGKTWLAAKSVQAICESENIVAFWLDSKEWNECESIFDLLYACFSSIYPSYEKEKIGKLQKKPAKIWRKTLIVLDGVNEWNAIEAAQRILAEYFRNDENENKWGGKVRFLLTTRPLDDYPDFESYLWGGCYKISVDPFNDAELQEALARKGRQLDDLPDSLKDIARIPRYFQRCLELRDELGSFDVVTKEMVLWADLLYKIKYTSDPQIQEFDWQDIEDAQGDLATLAKGAKWTNINEAPQGSAHLLKDCFINYHQIRRDLEEQRIALKAHKRQAELSEDHIVLGWALHLSNLFDSTQFDDIESLLWGFRQELQPIPSEDLRTEALFIALQISAISPPDISQDELSQKRAALMLAWLESHNARVTDERLSFWAEKDTDAYAQVVEFEFGFESHRRYPRKYRDALIEQLARTWINKKGQINRLASRLTKWLRPTYAEEPPEDVVYTHTKGRRSLPEKDDVQHSLLNAALLILSQRSEPQFLEPLARCYGILHNNEKFYNNASRRRGFYRNLARLMRWGYTEEILDHLHSLAERAQDNERLLKGVYGLAVNLGLVDLPRLLQRPPSEEDLEAFNFDPLAIALKPYLDQIREKTQLLIGETPANKVRSYYPGLDSLAIRTDLPGLTEYDKVEIKKVLHHITINAMLGAFYCRASADRCVDSLMPWVAKYDPKGYAKLAYSLKINTMYQRKALSKLLSIQGLIFSPEDCEKITETILRMQKRLLRRRLSYADVTELTPLLTELLLFSASEDKLTDWFKFLAKHEPLRTSIHCKPLPNLLKLLAPKSIVELAQRELATLRSSSSGNQSLAVIESKAFSEEAFWAKLDTYVSGVEGNTVESVLEELWMKKPDSTRTSPKRGRKPFEECLNDQEIMFMTLDTLVEDGEDELWKQVTRDYLASRYGKERNLGVSILPWFGTREAVKLLDQLKSEDPSYWVREHADWAYEVAQQERSCREVYREALQTRDLFRISAVFEQIKPALSLTAQWWHCEIEKEEFGEKSQDIDPKLDALLYRFWYRWESSIPEKYNVTFFQRTLSHYCRGEMVSDGINSLVAPWWKPTPDLGS